MIICDNCKKLTNQDEIFYNNEIEKYPFNKIDYEFNPNFECLCLECYEEEVRNDYNKNIK